MSKFEKQILILRSQLQGAGYFNALLALEKCLKYHKGKRKGGDPEWSHQISIALFAMTLPDIRDMERLITIIMLHDVREDYGVSNEEVIGWFHDREFGLKVAFSVDNMTKEYRGVRRPDEVIFGLLAEDEYGSIAKLCDRIHNISTMKVFTIERQKDYMKEVDVYFFPMLKIAKRNFPHHVRVYENIKHVLQMQLDLFNYAHQGFKS